jgi:hypothetical protein
MVNLLTDVSCRWGMKGSINAIVDLNGVIE